MHLAVLFPHLQKAHALAVLFFLFYLLLGPLPDLRLHIAVRHDQFHLTLVQTVFSRLCAHVRHKEPLRQNQILLPLNIRLLLIGKIHRAHIQHLRLYEPLVALIKIRAAVAADCRRAHMTPHSPVHLQPLPGLCAVAVEQRAYLHAVFIISSVIHRAVIDTHAVVGNRGHLIVHNRRQNVQRGRFFARQLQSVPLIALIVAIRLLNAVIIVILVQIILAPLILPPYLLSRLRRLLRRAAFFALRLHPLFSNVHCTPPFSLLLILCPSSRFSSSCLAVLFLHFCLLYAFILRLLLCPSSVFAPPYHLLLA